MLRDLVFLVERSIAHARYKMSRIPAGQILKQNGFTVLKDVYDACSKAGIRAFLAEGTLLGHHRENGFMRHDHDIDLGILEEDIKKIGILERELKKKGYEVTRKKYSIFLRYQKPNVDIHYFLSQGESIVSCYIEHNDNSLFRYDFPASIFSRLDEAKFAGELSVLVPCEVEHYLTTAYGNWRVPKQMKHLFDPNLRIENMKAGILADKRGTEPKSIRNLLRLLDKNGIVETVIVVGYKEDLIKTEIEKEDTRLEITYVRNDKYFESGTGYSLYLLKGLINDNTLLLEARTADDEYKMKQVIRSRYKNVVMIEDLLNDEDSVHVCIDWRRRITNIGHHIRAKDEKRVAGVCSGISKFSKELLSRLFEQVEREVRNNKLDVSYEEYISIMIKEDRSFPYLKIIRPDMST